jgi:PAS domain S-box-containing protein
MPEPTVWTVLVVEDRAGISAALLRSRPDFEVGAAHRLQAAERLFREKRFQAVLFDLALADIADSHGLDAYRRVRAMAPGIPIVALVPAGAEEASMALAAEGAAACLPRSSTTVEVLAWTLRQAVLRGRAEARRYRALFDSVPIGILLAAGRRVAMANPAALAALGCREDDLERISVPDLFPPDLRPLVESALDACLAGEARESALDAGLRRPDGSTAPCRVSMKGAILNDAPVLALYLALREAAGPEAETAALPRAQERMEALGRLAAGIAHDFNNLFTAINGHADHLLSMPQAEGAMARGLRSIRKAGEEAASLARGLQALGGPGSGEARATPVDAAVDASAPGLGSLLGPSARLRVRPGAGPAAAMLEPGQLERILAPLCARARRSMPHGGTVTVSTATATSADPSGFTHLAPASPGPYVVVTVQDDGSGMDGQALERVFEPYADARHGQREPKAAGLALAEAFAQAALAGGGLSVRRGEDGGTVFRLWLPRADVPAVARSGSAGVPEASAGPAVPAAPAGEAGAGSSGVTSEEPERPCVLVVEDEPSLREMLRAVLERYGFRVAEADSGASAEEYFRSGAAPPALVISDVLLRDGLGTELAERLREAEPSARFLFISGHTLETLEDQAIRIGNEPFLAKPFTPAQLHRMVRDALAGSARQPR